MTERTRADCAAMRAEISAYLDGDLDAVACEAIERHCRDCAPCAALVEDLRAAIGLCREAGKAPLPEAIRQRAKASMAELLAAAKRRPT